MSATQNVGAYSKMSATQNVGYLKCRRLQQNVSYSKCRLLKMSTPTAKCQLLKMSAPTAKCQLLKMSAPKLLTIWARRTLHSALLLSPAEVLVLSFWRCCSSTFWSSSGICSQTCPAYMGAMPAVLARPVQNMPKCRHPRWNVGAYILALFSENFRRSLGANCSAPSTLIKEL